MIPPEHQRIIDEIMAGGRIMPPKDERIRQRDALLAARRAATLAPEPIRAQEATTTASGASGYYASKHATDNFTGD